MKLSSCKVQCTETCRNNSVSGHFEYSFNDSRQSVVTLKSAIIDRAENLR